MRRGTTPINTFTTDVDLQEATVFISYEQRGLVVIEKTGEDLSFGSVVHDEDVAYTITVELTQEETLALVPGKVDIQIRAVFADGSAIASNIVSTTAERILKEGVIEYAV